MNEQQLENIELRLAGVRHRPWTGDSKWLFGTVTCEARYKMERDTLDEMAVEKLIRPEDVERLTKDVQRRGSAGQVLPAHIEAAFEERYVRRIVKVFRGPMGDGDEVNFIAHAPDDVEALIKSNRAQAARIARLEVLHEEASREATKLRGQLSDLELRHNRIVNALGTIKSMLP